MNALNPQLEDAAKLEPSCLLPVLRDRCTPSILLVFTAGVDVLSCEQTPCAFEQYSVGILESTCGIC